MEVTGAHVSGTFTHMVVQLVRTCLGEAGVDDLVARADQRGRVDELSSDEAWSTYDEFRHLLVATEELLGRDCLWQLPQVVMERTADLPKVRETLHALGSPSEVLSRLGNDIAGTSRIEDGYAEQVDATTWDIGRRLHAGFEPYEQLCRFNVATSTLLPTLYGYTGIHAEEVSCQRQGDLWCTARVSWNGEDAEHRVEFLESSLAMAEQRLAVFQETLSDIATTERLDEVLERIVVRTAEALHVAGLVLELEPLPWSTRLVYATGMSEAEAHAHAADTVGDLVVGVRSGGREYGRILVVGARRIVPRSMRTLVHGYAQLTATAIESALAVHQARRQAQQSKVLLDLATRLTRAPSVRAAAQTLAVAAGSIVDCDRTTVALIIDGEARPIAVHGFPPALAAETLEARFTMLAPFEDEPRYVLPGVAPDVALEGIRSFGAEACVLVPIVVEGRSLGWLSVDVVDEPARLTRTAELDSLLRGLAGQAGIALQNALLLDRVRYQADHDSLTGLPNRKVLVERLTDSTEETNAAVLFVDLDDFKDVNDGLGHHAGDVVLREVATRLREAVRDEDMVARLGGDEFAVIVHDADDTVARAVAARVTDAFAQPFEVEGLRISLTASVGLATCADPEQLLRSADMAMYRAKAGGKGQLAQFEAGMDHDITERLTLHAELADGIAAGELRLLFQPVFDLEDGRLRSAEALVRWEHPRLGLLAPDRFISLAESTGLIEPLGSWVLHEACRVAASWPEEISIAVNMSPRQLDDDRAVEHVRGALTSSGLDHSRLILEITESVLAHDPTAMVPRLEALHDLGVRIAIDDFGTGYSSLSVLVELPVDILKIDRTFIARMLERQTAADLVQVLIDMGRTLGLDVVAEGIEEVEQALALRQQRCQYGQGFLYAQPLPANDFAALLQPVPNR